MPAQKHNFTVTEIKAGLMVIAALAVFAVFVAAVQGLRPPAEVRTYYAYFKDTQGLNKGADVRFGGAKAGRVAAIDLDEARPAELRVTAELKPTWPINADSVASVAQTTLTAEKHLEISTGSVEAERLADGGEIQSGGGGLFSQADEIARGVRDAIKDVTKLLGVKEYAEDKEHAQAEDKEKLVTIADIFADMKGTVHEGTGFVQDVRGVISDSREDINSILDKIQDVEKVATEFVEQLNTVIEENQPDIRGSIESLHRVLDDVSEISKRLSERLDGLANALQTTLDNAESLAGSARDTLEKNRPVIEDMILDAREAVRQLKEFSRTIAEQPHSVIMGQEPKGRKPRQEKP